MSDIPPTETDTSPSGPDTEQPVPATAPARSVSAPPRSNEPPSKRRLVVVAVIAAAILFAIVIATGRQTLSSPNNAPSVTQSAATAAPAPTSSVAVKGAVTVAVHHLKGHTWRFRYTVRATGKTPIAGFQLSGSTARLFHVVGPAWNYYGTGLCKQIGPAGLLIYWSTNTAAGGLISPGKSKVFGFDANTSGPATISYSVSYGTAAPQFGHIQAPASSTLKPSVPCK